MYFETGAALAAALAALPTSKKGSYAGFDAFYYGSTYMSGYNGDLSPIDHFVQIGAERGYKPNADFDPSFYGNQYADLRGQGFDAADLLYHFMQFGLDEGRAQNADYLGFDADAYFTANPDVEAFVAANLDLFNGSMENGAIAHYIKFGEAEGRSLGNVVSEANLRLTVNDDSLSGTNAADLIAGRIGTVGGVEANTLNSGDSINGQGGTDTLMAQVMSGAAFGNTGSNGSQVRPIQPEISNVEVIKLEAQYRSIVDEASGGEDSNVDDVYVRASEMTDVVQLWSNKSTGDLIIQDLTTLTSAGVVRNTNTMTIGMAYTGNTDSHWDESDYKVYFDQDYLIPRSQNDGGQLFIELMDMDSALAGGNPLEDNPWGEITFTMGGVEKVLNYGAAANTYAELLAAIQAAIATAALTDPDFAQLSAAFGPEFTATDTDLEPGGSTQGTTIVITNSGAEQLQAVGMRATGTAPSGKDFHTGFSSLPPGTENIPVEINVALEKAGLSGDGGALVIGSMNKGSNDNNSITGDRQTHNDTVEGFQKFNVTVLGNSEKSSSLSELRSTNNTLQTVIVTSETRTDGSYAHLDIGNTQSGERYGLKDVATFDSTAFLSDMYLFAGLTNEMDEKYGTSEMNVNYDFGIGNDYFNLEVNQNQSQALNVDINMGEGNDEAEIWIDGDAVDAVTESFAINLGNGNNDLVIEVELGDGTNDFDLDGVSNATTSLLKNLSITSGSGADYVEVLGNGEFDITVNAESDMVFINAGGDFGRTNIWGADGIGGIGDPNPLLNGIALYNAKLSIRYAGFESTVDIATGPDFIANLQDINNAIIAAIAANPELARLLSATVGTTDQDLIVRALIDGDNGLELLMYQPQLVTSLPTNAGEVVLQSTHVNALATALIATGRAANSAAIDIDADGIEASEVAAYFTGTASLTTNAAGVNGPFVLDEAAPLGTYYYDFYDYVGSGSEGSVINTSVIDMGTGANDLVVLSSNDLSSNTLVFSAAWGKVSVVNFFTNELTAQPNGGDTEGDSTGEVMTNGLHLLDFTAFLTNTFSSSGSSHSVLPIAIDYVDATGNVATLNNSFAANNIVFADLEDLEQVATNTTDLSFATLSATQVQTILNLVGGVTSTSQTGGTLAEDVVQATRTSLFFVQNVDADATADILPATADGLEDQEVIAGISGTNYNNYGEYKVFQVTYGTDASIDTTFSVSLIGTIDFGNSLDLAAGALLPNLVGAVAP